MRKIICDGDSWVFGCEIVCPNLAKKYKPDVHPGTYDFLPENDAYRIPRIFPTHLSKIYDCEVINLSWPADDNGTILHRTMNYISHNYLARKIKTDDLLVIVGWSSPERNFFWYKDDEMSRRFRLWPQVAHFDAKPQQKIWELYVSHLWNEEEYLPRYVMNVLQFQNFCQANNIKWLCFNSFYQTPKTDVKNWVDLNIVEELERIKYKIGSFHYRTNIINQRLASPFDYRSLWETVDPIRFYKKDQPRNTFKSYIESITKDNYMPLTGWHPSPEGHYEWALELKRYIEENKLL